MRGRWQSWAFCAVAVSVLLQAQPQSPAPTEVGPVEQRMKEFFEQLAPVQRHFEGSGESEEETLIRQRRNYQQIVREKVAGSWFAALVSTTPESMDEIRGRFESWKGFVDFILARDAVVDLWSPGEGGMRGARRIPAPEIAEIRREPHDRPLLVTLTYRDPDSGEVVTHRAEFGFGAADTALAAQRAYSEQRGLQSVARRILGTRGTGGKFTSLAQWDALQAQVQAGGFAVTEMPARPSQTNDLFVAVEYEVNEANYLTRVKRLWRESEITPLAVRQPDGTYVQALILKGGDGERACEVRAFRVRGVTEELEPVRAPLLGQDSVELRVVNPGVPDPRRWNVLEFCEPALVRQASLAEFSLVSAYLDKHRKEIALTRSKLDLFAEPIFAGLNIGCGLAAVPFPVGAAARLGYNVALTPFLIPPAPSVKQMRELARLVASRESLPELKTKPARYLDEADYRELKQHAAAISEADLDQFLDRIQDEDIRAMLRLAKMAHLDQEITNLLNILAGAAKVSGWSDEPGPQRDLLNSVYFSVNGEINLKNIIAVIAGAKNATPLSGVSLETLAEGDGPLLAWLQYLDVTVDIRAIANTVSRLMHRDLANKELKMPFPYATRMTDLAAYEIRIFGYPLFIYYKRGLMKDDYAAFQNDYAYGLIGAKIVEHFRTREEMDEEIRANRMMPLGFVRVPDGKGGWKESNLAVFAHRVPRGVHEGKTAIIIYGLKAYSDQSHLMQREYHRLKKFEQALEEGGVIEQLVEADDRHRLASQDFEPVIHPGTNEAERSFSPLLGNLLEWRRHLRRSALGLPEFQSEASSLMQVQRFLESRGVDLGEKAEDPLLGVDKYGSSFLYRRRVEGAGRTYKVVTIPSRAEIVRDLEKSAEAQRVERIRRESIGPGGHGVALVNEARRVGDRYELGPLLRDELGKVDGAGVRPGVTGVNGILQQLEVLPVIERAKVRSADFASILMRLPGEGRPAGEKVFVTIEFPIDVKLERTLTNAITGQTEVHTYHNGRLERTVTGRAIVEADYDSRDTETGTRTYWNKGTSSSPSKGKLLEATRTTDVWARRPVGDRDPYQPTLIKVRANYITGVATRETYGAFSLPVTTADDLFVVSNRFNSFGQFSSATVWDNGRSDAEFGRPWSARVTSPMTGRARFDVASTIPPEGLARMVDAGSTGYRTTVVKRDLVKGLTRTQTFDNAAGGRRISEAWTDPMRGEAKLEVEVVCDYRDDFHFGFVPLTTRKVSGAGIEMLRTTTVAYDALTRRLTAIEQDYAEAARTKVWDYRWDSPVFIESAGRRTDIQFNREETSQTSTTVAIGSGEEMAASTGEFDRALGVWRIGRTYWYRPGVTNRVLTETRSPFGMLLSTQTKDVFLSLPAYDTGGIERSNRVFRRNPATSQFDLLHRVEDSYVWRQGRRRARVQTYIEARPYDVFTIQADDRGRVVEDAMRDYPDVKLVTSVTYEGDSDRIVRAEELQNGTLRTSRESRREQQQPDGRWLLPVITTPRWGLISTQWFVLGDPLGRPVQTRLENGDAVQVREWFADAAVARVSEVAKQDGRTIARSVTQLNSGTNGAVPYDLTRRYRVGFWGAAGLAAEEALVRGTDLALFTEVADERTFFDTRQSFKAPLFSVDPDGLLGVNAMVDGSRRTNILALFRARLPEAVSQAATNGRASLRVEKADLRGLLFHRVTEQAFDRSGRLLEEIISRIPNSGKSVYSNETVFDVPRITLARFKPEYHAGWFVESQDAVSGGRVLSFTNQVPGPGNRSYRVNQDGFPDTVTQTEGKVFGSTGESEAARFRDSFFRRIHNVRFLERNPHMPGLAEFWSASTRTDLRQDGSGLFDLESIFDGQGRARVERAVKATSSGTPGTRIVYQVVAPEAEVLKISQHAPGQQSVWLETFGRTNFTGSDFLYLFALGVGESRLVITDASGRTAKVGGGDSDFGAGVVPRWRIHPMHVRWLPDDIEPRHGTELLAPARLHRSGDLVSVSVHDLSRAGLDVSDLRSFALVFTNSTPLRLALSPVRALERMGPFLGDQNRREYLLSEISHSSGLRTIMTVDRSRTERDYYTGQKMDALVEFNGLPVATARTRSRLAEFPHLLWLDNSDPDLARPLYAVSERDGRFLEYYQMLRPGDAHLYVAPGTFEVPRLEIYRAGVLHDELYPGVVGYGRDYKLSIPISRSGSFLGQAQATLRQRVEANLFRYNADQMSRRNAIGRTEAEGVRQFNYLRFQEANTRAREITQQPTAAQALVNIRDLPWSPGEPTEAPTVPVDWKELRVKLRRAQASFSTGLIPTSPNTDAEPFVDTVKEADLIVLAVKLGEPALAAELLKFYRDAFLAAREPLRASYDGRAGTAMKTDVRFIRAGQSDATAEAQLAIADAAFHLGFETGDPQWLSFGRSLLQVVMAEFRGQVPANGISRGIAEYWVQEPFHILGLKFWPDASIYSLASNARAYLLLKRLSPLAVPVFNDPEWRIELAQALSEQEDFLKTQVLPEVERTGVVPGGLFEIQDLEQGSSAIGVQRWTTADDWLRFLDAAPDLGVPLAACRVWLENLVRVHGVQVGSVWGLDWCLALLRDDAISPELTARFMRVARRLDHLPAQAFAAQNLNIMQRNDLFPVVITAAPRDHALNTGKDFTVRPWTDLRAWPGSLSRFRDLREIDNYGWNLSRTPAPMEAASTEKLRPTPHTDLTVFIFMAGGAYLCVLGSALFWWGIRALRRRRSPGLPAEAVVPEEVMQRSEERWAKRVLGLQTSAVAEHWRFSNAPVEQNFLVQLRAIYKLALEWRRLENGWNKNDVRLVEDASDGWLNGADEYAVVVGLYMRSVIKIGVKDGFPRTDVLTENEDSNHIWSRLTLFFSEHLWSLGAAVSGWQKARGGPAQDDFRSEIELTLEALGIRKRTFGFDARPLFNYPANPYAMDLLIVQDPARTLSEVMADAALKLDIPLEHIRNFIERYKEFKAREKPYPIHPYLVEFAKEMPHFALMGLGAIVLYNQKLGDSPIIGYLKKTLVTDLGLRVESLFWAVPLLSGIVLMVIAHLLRVYRFEAAIRPRVKTGFFLDATLTSLFVKTHEAEPRTRGGRWRDPEAYERWGWVFRSLGYVVLAVDLFRLSTPSFGTFLIVKGMFAPLALVEVAGVVLPLVATAFSKFVQDRAHKHRWLASINRLNITATRPASPVWLSIKYHAQPSMPTGTRLGLTQAVVFYFLMAASFFFGAGYLCQQIFPLWFTDVYLQAQNLKLVIGGAVFGLVMVLLRYGLFLLFTSIASLFAAFPILSLVALAAVAQILVTFFAPSLDIEPGKFAPGLWGGAMLMVALAMFEKRFSAWFRHRREGRKQDYASPVKDLGLSVPDPRLGIVYMSGDDLSGLKLQPDLLMSRWTLLHERLDSSVVPILRELAGKPDDATLRSWFEQLHVAEKKSAVTLWHPMQLQVEGAPIDSGLPKLPSHLGVSITVGSEMERQRLLAAWHIRRWLVCMMSTAGHSQDTAINLVDMALRLQQEGLSEKLVFYLIQNKYDNSPNNRPSQTAYDQGELAHRNKLARLLCAVAPGARAHCLQNWTPFGFKAGGLTGMDLVYEESLRLSTLLMLDRNATVHDLDALMLDLREAMADPNLVIVIPGRSTTNTLTPVGQGSQLVEEGHRSFLRGLISVLGGDASESVGTGWGNVLACFYGRVQRALLTADGRKMPLTSRMLRGTSFAERTEGLIGFGPHAVGISEDIWAVVQAMNTALGLGLRPRFALSRALWHKVRETWSHAEWLASFPRWAGGYYQMVHDPLMQRIYDFGPQSVFARELRSNSGRSFLSAPLALVSILMMPLAIIFDVSPFVQTLVVLWNCGFVLNQVLTLHALNTYLESCGFCRFTALVGAAGGGAVSWVVPSCQPYGPGLVLAGLLFGGFFVGLSRWLVTRVRDLVLFGPQLVLHGLAQTVRLSLEFTVSGTSAEDARHVSMRFRAWAGPREDRPLDDFAGFMNLQTVIWGFGLFSLLLCLFALTRLDMLNVLLLLPSLLFSVSTLVGPFLMTSAPGKSLGLWVLVPRVLGWVGAGLFYALVSLLAAQGRGGRWGAVGLLALAFGIVLVRALGYLPFKRRVGRHTRRLVHLLKSAGAKTASFHNLANQVLQACLADFAKIPLLLQKAGLEAGQQSAILHFAEKELVPLLRAPVLDLQRGILARSRWAVECSRSFVLGLLIFLWFFLVPVPGLIVFTSRSYPESLRFTVTLEQILTVLAGGIAISLVSFWISRLIQWIDLGALRTNGLRQRLHSCFTRFKDNAVRLTQAQTSSGFALLTDTQTYIDQRSYAYARRSIEAAERILRSGAEK